jgi:hypothetical protein
MSATGTFIVHCRYDGDTKKLAKHMMLSCPLCTFGLRGIVLSRNAWEPRSRSPLMILGYDKVLEERGATLRGPLRKITDESSI